MHPLRVDLVNPILVGEAAVVIDILDSPPSSCLDVWNNVLPPSSLLTLLVFKWST